MRLHRSSIVAAALFCGVFSACQTGPSTKLVSAWQLPGYVPMGFKRVLVLTYKPAVRDAWRDDLCSHTDFTGWVYADRDRPADPAARRCRPWSRNWPPPRASI